MSGYPRGRRYGKVRTLRSYDRSPLNFGLLRVDGVDYAIQYYFRLADSSIVMSSPEMGGVGPVYSKSESEARQQMIQLLRDRKEGKGGVLGWTESEVFYNHRHGEWERRHGYGDGSQLKVGLSKQRPRVDSRTQIGPGISGGQEDGEGITEDEA